MSSSNNKMKGLLKGLRYISQIFDNEKEQEMQIGLPTDVKHVAHIGWDGAGAQAPANAPTWMNEFKSEAAASGPLPARATPNGDSASNWVSQDSGARKVSRGQSAMSARDMPELPKSSRRSTSTNSNGTTMKEKSSDKAVRQKKASKNSSKKERGDPNQLGSDDLPSVPKKSGRRKKTNKETSSSEVGSSCRRTNDLDNYGSESGSVHKARLSNASSASGFDDIGDQGIGHSGRIS